VFLLRSNPYSFLLRRGIVWVVFLGVAISCIIIACLGKRFDFDNSIRFGKNSNFSDESNQLTDYCMETDGLAELKQIESWIKKKQWWFSLVYYLPQKKVSTDTLRVDLIGKLVILEVRKTIDDVWWQYQCKSDNEIKTIFDSLQVKYEKKLQQKKQGK
jgi:hypothetical protein